MNHIYRNVWNACTGTWMAVAENAPSRGKRSGAVVRRTALAAAAFASGALGGGVALAQPAPSVAVSSGNTRAYVAPNGVTVVNIATPNAAGLSHNKYTSYNVNAAGLVLNNGNSEVMARQSQLAGQVLANTNLTKQAGVILNEVVSNNRSTLAGFTEVLGGKADVIVANPYGITCSGCGFINTDRVVLSTGNPYLAANGGLGGFSIGQGDILVTGTGLNASAQQVLDLVTRSARLEAPINGVDISIVTGTNQWDYATRNVTGSAAASGAAPTYSIDTSVLGGMYANRIRLMATEAGVGVRMAGDAAASAQDFTLSAAGKVELQGRVSAARDLAVATSGALSLGDASLNSAGKTTLSAGGAASLSGSALVAGTDLAVNAASLVDSASAAGLADNNLRHAGGQLTLAITDSASLGATQWSAGASWNGQFGNLLTTDATRLYANGGTLIASADKGDLALGLALLRSAGGMTLNAAGRIGSVAGGAAQALGGTLALNAGNGIANAGTLSADAGSVLLRADGSIANSGQVYAAQDLDIADRTGGATQSLDNRGTLVAEQALRLQAGAVGNAAGARIQAQSGSQIAAGSLNNAGTLLLSQLAGASDSMALGGAFANTGTVQGAGSLAVTAGSANNQGLLLAANTLDATTVGDWTNSGTVQAGDALLLGSGGTLRNSSTGVLKSAGLSLSAGNGLTNAGMATADTGNATLRVNGTLDNSGQLQAAQAIDIADRNAAASQAVVNSGKLLAGQAMALKAASITNQAAGRIQAATGSTVAGGSLSNAGTWLLSTQAGASDTVTLSGSLDNSGSAQSAGTLSASASQLANSGALLAAGDLSASTTAGLANANGGTLQAGGALALDSGGALGNAADGVLRGGTSVNLRAGAGLDNAGTVTADGGAATVRVDGLLANSGQVHAATSLDIADRNGGATGTLNNSGGLLADQGLALKAAGVTNTATGRVQASTGSTVAASSLNNAGTWLLSQQAGAADTVNVSGALTNSGRLQGAGDASLSAASIANTGQVLAARNLAIALGTSLGNTGNNAVLQGGQRLTVTGAGAALTNATGARMLGDGLAIDVASLDNNAGTIQGGSRNDSSIAASGTVRNRAGSLMSLASTATGAGSISATTIDNAGTLQSAGAMTLNVGTGGFTDSGTAIAEGNLTLQGRSGGNYNANVSGLLQSGAQLSLQGGATSVLDVGASGTAMGDTVNANLGRINLANGATLMSDNAMTLNLGTLTLAGADAAVLGAMGTGSTALASITTSNALVNNGLLFSSYDLSVVAPSVTNSAGLGGIAALHNLNVRATTGNLVNQGALYAGNALSAYAEAGTLSNTATLSAYQGTISAGNSIYLKANTVLNNSTIDSNGSVTVVANTLRNEVVGGDSRAYGAETPHTAATETGHWGKDYLCNDPFDGDCYDQHEYWYYKSTWSQQQYFTAGQPQVKPQIMGGALVDLSFNTATNLGGVISGNTVRLTGTGANASFTNDELALHRIDYTQTWTEHTQYIAAGGATYFDRRRESDTTTNATVKTSSIGAGVFAASLTGSNFTLTNNGSTQPLADMRQDVNDTPQLTTRSGDAATGGSVSSPVGGAGTTGPASFGGARTVSGQSAISFVGVNAANGVSGTSFGGINLPLPSNPNGLYVIAKEPGAHYLVETNPRYRVGASSVGSDYLAKQLGYDPDTLLRRLGDDSYEAYLIKQQLVAQTGNGLLNGYQNASLQVQRLMDQAATESKSLGLVYGQALTPAQQAALKQDIVWMVQTEINGQVVLAPVVYLSAQTKAAVVQGAVISAEVAQLSVTSLTNTGGTISGSNALQITSVGDVRNTSGTITGGNVAVSSTQGSIVNETATSGSGNDLRYVTDVGKTATISSTGNLSLDAAQDITNKGANVSAGGDASLKAGGNVSFDTVENKNTDTTRGAYSQDGGKGMTTTTTTTVEQMKSGLSTGGNLSVTAGKDITLAGTDAKVGGNADLNAGGNLNIVARENSTTSHTESQASGFGMGGALYGSSQTTTDSLSVRNVGSTFEVGGNANLTAKNDVTLQGSTMNVAGSGSINATNVNVLAGRNYDETNSTTTSTSFMKATNGGTQTSSSSGSNASASSGTTSAQASAGAAAETGSTSSGGVQFASSSTTTSKSTDLKNVGSSISFGGDLTVNASKDVTLVGSTVSANNTTVNAQNINIVAAQDVATSSSTTTTTSVGLMGSSDNKAGASADAKAQASGNVVASGSANANAQASASTDNKLDLMQTSTTTRDSLDVTNQGSAITSKGNTTLTAGNAINVVGSQIGAGGDVNLTAKDMTFTAATDVHEVRTTSDVTSAGLYASGEAKASAGANASAGTNTSADASAKASAGLEVGLYGSNTQSSSVEGSTTAKVSGITAGGSINRNASNSITDVGTAIEAGGNFSQSAKTITSLAAADTTYASSSSTTNTAKIGAYAEASAGVSAQGSLTGGENKTDNGASAGAGIKASYEYSKEGSQSASSNAVVSTIKVGGNVTSTSSGATTLQGTQIAAGKDVTLGASSLDYSAAQNTASSSSTNTKAGGSVGVDLVNKSVTVGGSYENGKESSSSSTAVVGGIQSGGNLTVKTTGDARFEGTSLAAGKAATVDAGGNVRFDAAQNTSTSSGQSANASAEITAGKKSGGSSKGFEAEGGYSQTQSQSSEAVTGSIASGGPLTVKSGGDTTFTGTQLASGGDTTVAAGGNLAFNAARSTSSSQEFGVSASVGASSETSNKGGKSTSSKSGEVGVAGNYGQSSSNIATGSTVTSGGDIKLSSGKNTTLEGTQAKAAGSVAVAAGGTVDIKAAKSSSSSVGVGLAVGGSSKTETSRSAPAPGAAGPMGKPTTTKEKGASGGLDLNVNIENSSQATQLSGGKGVTVASNVKPAPATKAEKAKLAAKQKEEKAKLEKQAKDDKAKAAAESMAKAAAPARP